jgi:solute carrier family 35 (UDP-sugar transporter), member A1/2/3
LSTTTTTTTTAIMMKSSKNENGVGNSISTSSLKTLGLNGNGGSSSEHSNGSSMNAPASAAAAAAAQFKLLLLVGMVLQNSSTVLVGRYTRAGVAKADQYDVNHLIVIIELGKLLLSCALEFYYTGGQLLDSLQLHIWSAPEDAVKIVIPALLYLVQNTLLYVALSNLTAPLFQVTYQCKLVTTAVVSVLMLKVKYSLQQWICLTVISIGVAIVVLGETKDDPSKTSKSSSAQNLTVGLTAVTIACFSSACAGVYFEMVLKKPGGNAAGAAGNGNTNGNSNSNNNGNGNAAAITKPAASLWMRNIQLSFISIIIAVLQSMFQDDPIGHTYLHGFTGWTWVLVLLQAAGGLLVAAVIKYADNVLKGLATGVSVVLATAASMVLFGTPLTSQFLIGAVMILISVYYFSNPLPPTLATHVKKMQEAIYDNSTGGGSTTSSRMNGKDNHESRVEIKSLLPK